MRVSPEIGSKNILRRDVGFVTNEALVNSRLTQVSWIWLQLVNASRGQSKTPRWAPAGVYRLRVNYQRNGWVAEWSKAPVLKTGVGQPTVGSNPTPSALFFCLTPMAASPKMTP